MTSITIPFLYLGAALLGILIGILLAKANSNPKGR